MDKGTLARILRVYGTNGQIVGAPQKGYRNSSHLVQAQGRQLNLILYKSEQGILPRILRANAVGAAVAAAGLPARTLADKRIIKLSAGARLKYAALYHYLPGKTIPWEAYTMEHIKQLGGAMAAMHKSLKRYNVAKLPDVTTENEALCLRMTKYFKRDDVAKAAAEKLHIAIIAHDHAEVLRNCEHLPHKQALHMDFVRGNILFEGSEITGIIDFEKTAAGSPLFDVARTLAFLLVDCKSKPENKIRKYFLHSGYIKRGGVNIADYTINGTSVLEWLINFFLLHDLYKFMRHNPYESLSKNEHYVRTKALLLKRGLIAKV